jgi:hypothetical protein
VDGISNDVFVTKDGKRIMDVNSSLTSSMTDNTKYGYNSKLNLDIQTLSVVSLLTMNKVKIYDAIRFINSQYVVKYGKETTQYAVQTETEESRKKEVGNDLLNELLTRAKNANGGTRTDTEIQMEGKGPVTNEDLVIVTRLNPRSKALVNKTNAERRAFYDNLDPQERYAYYMAELRILNAYLTLSKKHTPELIAFSQIVKLTKGIASSTKETSFKGDEDLRNYLETLNLKLVHTVDGWRVEYGDAKPEDLPLYDFKDILNRHLISLENLKVFADKTEAQKNYFISQTKFAETLRKKLNRGLKKRMKNKVRTKAMTQIRRDMESFLMITAWRNSLPENERENLNNYLFTDIAEKNGVLSLVALKEDLMARYPHLEKNLVLQQNIINFKNDQEGLLSKLEANTRSKGNKGFEGMLLTAMRVLANNEGYPLVNAMIKHLIAKNGLQFKNDSPIGLFSPGIYGNEFPFSTLMDEYTSVLNSGNEEDFVRVFGKTPNKLIEEFQELFMLDVNNRDFITKLPEKLLDTAAPEKLVSPVTVTSTGFTIDFDKGVLNKINEALYDDVTGQLVETLDTTDSDRKQRGYNLKKLEAFQFEKKNQQLKRRDKKVAVFDFPKFIQIGKDKYKLKEYVLADNRYEKDEKRFSTEPDSDGNYLGTAATYEKVPTLGYWGVSVIGRTLEEANERTFDDMLALVKKAKGGEQAAMEAADELDMVDDLFDYAAPVSNIPSTPVQVIPQLFTQGTSTRKTYSGKITSLQPNQIFVFGSNEGSSKGAAPTHGAGAAKLAKDKFGAIQGQSRGIQGQSYAIVTKKFYDIEKSSTPQEIITEIKSLYEYAKQNPNKEFLVSDYSESNLNGYTGQEMADMFNLASPIPSNIVFNENFDKLIQSSAQPVETPMSKQDQLVQKNMQGLTGATVTAGAADTASKDLLIFSLTSKGFKTVSDLFYKMYTESFKKNGAPIPAIFAKLQQMGIFAQKDEVNPAFNDAVRKVVMEASPEEVNEMNQKLC